jgi:hypothetical protein
MYIYSYCATCLSCLRSGSFSSYNHTLASKKNVNLIIEYNLSKYIIQQALE